MSDLNIQIKVFDRGAPNQLDSEDKILFEYRDDAGVLQKRSAYLSVEQFHEYREDRFSQLSAADRGELLKASRIYSRASVTWFRDSESRTIPGNVGEDLPLSPGLSFFVNGAKPGDGAPASLVEAFERALLKNRKIKGPICSTGNIPGPRLTWFL